MASLLRMDQQSNICSGGPVVAYFQMSKDVGELLILVVTLDATVICK